MTWNIKKRKKNMVYLCTPKGELIYVYLNLKNNIIKSATRGGIARLRECGWSIAKKC
jgi:hypothetical protein|tara:strand:- start:662 stop:832 length:171 start_codon:yes stop_codon:yes gene_type:complete